MREGEIRSSTRRPASMKSPQTRGRTDGSPSASQHFFRSISAFSSLSISAIGRDRRILLDAGGLDEMQDACEQSMRLSRAADVDDSDPLKFVGEDIHDQLEDIVVEGAERAVNEHPRRILQQDAGNREAKLLV